MTNSIPYHCPTPPNAPLPSRHGNPFATCWTKPGAIAFRSAGGESAEQVVARLAGQNWWGEILGPHGSGKSTLLESLKPLLSAAGRQVSAATLRDGQRRLPRHFLRGALSLPQLLVIVDGYEQLSRLSRAWLQWKCQRSAAGLLITSHISTGLPPLVRLQPDLTLVEQLVAELTQFRPSAITSADIAASHACRGSNVRELLFDLYDRHEAASGASRTGAAAVA
jgi:energy-coupling factor transporter ATP-binding protein EcfA2